MTSERDLQQIEIEMLCVSMLQAVNCTKSFSKIVSSRERGILCLGNMSETKWGILIEPKYLTQICINDLLFRLNMDRLIVEISSSVMFDNLYSSRALSKSQSLTVYIRLVKVFHLEGEAGIVSWNYVLLQTWSKPSKSIGINFNNVLPNVSCSENISRARQRRFLAQF